MNFLVWNDRGINSQGKWDAIRSKIEECSASVVCLQETKRELFDDNYLKNFFPRALDKFAFSPSDGTSGGLIVIWNSARYSGQLVHSNAYSITLKMECCLSGKSFHLTNIYGPCTPDGKVDFINWLYNVDTERFEDWVLAGDFNLIRSPNDRNRPGANVQDIMLFNDLISHLDLAEIKFQGRQFSWSNMQSSPLLEKLDWVFTSSSWALSFPDTMVKVLGKPLSDHSPFVIIIGTGIPRSPLFRFENYWLNFPDF